MAEYIKREDALKIMKDAWMLYTSGDDAIQEAIDCISLLPAADVVERKKGKWNGELVKRLRAESALPYSAIKDMRDAADAIEELICEVADEHNRRVDAEERQRWIPATERLPECEWGAEVGNIEWISCGMVFAGCFGRGGKYRDAYFRTWTDGTEGIDAKDADYWRQIQIPEPPKEES